MAYGGLRELGNIRVHGSSALRRIRVHSKKIDAALKICHGWGTTGTITALEMSLALAFSWTEVIISFDDFMTPVRFGY